MIELPADQYHLILPLATSLKQKVLPSAVIEGFNQGWIFIDQLASPSAALIGLPCGYFFAAGTPPGPDALAEMAQILQQVFVPRSRAVNNFGFLISFSSPDWFPHVNELMQGKAHFQVYRSTFHLDPRRFNQSAASLAALPSGFTPREINASALRDIPPLKKELAATWRSYHEFLKNGFGTMITYKGQIASYCLSVFRSAQAVEISIATAEPFRKQGLALQVSAAFISHCLEAGILPNWECFSDNIPSIKLAEKLGYQAEGDIPYFYWEEPQS